MTVPVFLKWAGGKRRILNEIEKKLPPQIDRYFEPFLGAGAVFFMIKEKRNPNYCCISDINENLINAYIDVRDNLDILKKRLEGYKKKNSRDFYYMVREKYNKGEIKGINRSAAFIYLNRACFNGLYRVNSKNEFNVPYGLGDNNLEFNDEILDEANKLLQGVTIKCQDYRKIERSVRRDDFVYLDPCYDPLKKTSFTSYTAEPFDELNNRKNLYNFIDSLDRKNAHILLSNNDIKDIKDLYYKFSITEVMVTRPINSVADNRGKIKELLISNY